VAANGSAQKNNNSSSRVEKVARKVSRSRISRNQRKILEVLEKYGELTVRDIAEILWARDISYRSPHYSSVHRSLTTLQRKGLTEKVGGRVKWRKTKNK
jgi:Fe2+ or Zn2+ uptake regulation protein